MRRGGVDGVDKRLYSSGVEIDRRELACDRGDAGLGGLSKDPIAKEFVAVGLAGDIG